MSMIEPLRFLLPNETVKKLNLSYEPFEWPALEKFAFQGGFSIKEPWEGHKEKKWYAEQRKPYEQLQSLLAPHHERWVEADCIAAFLPDADGQEFSVQINGVTLTECMIESSGLRRRMLLQKLPILVTTCTARIIGGGVMPHGDKRGYGVVFDIKPFSR
jgi:hypothetical protein